MSAVLLRFCLKCGLTALNTIWKQDRRFMESIIRFWERRVRARIACMFIQVFDNLPNTTLLIELSLNANPSTASYKVCGNAGAERGFNKVTESHKYQFEPAFGRILMAFLHVDGIRPKVPVQTTPCSLSRSWESLYNETVALQVSEDHWVNVTWTDIKTWVILCYELIWWVW